MEENPRLRPVEIFPVRVDGQDMLCLRDPQGFAEHPLFLSKPVTFLIARMDGSNTLRDIQADFFRATGEILPFEKLIDLVEQLDQQRYLDSSRFRGFIETITREFRDSLVRPAHHAGVAYESGPEALRSQMESCFEPPDGPGRERCRVPDIPVRGLVSPHIDFQRGGPIYAHAFKALADNPASERFVVFGTCHTPMRRRFALTRKDFVTPLGSIPADREFVDRLAAGLPLDYFEDEFAHRGEHSIELQAVFLRFTRGLESPIRIVPILVGSFQDIFECGRTPAGDREVQTFVQAVRQTLVDLPAPSAIIAGADLAHVGRRFGDPSGPTRDTLREVEAADRMFLDQVAAGDAEAVFQSIAEERDRRRVCGYPPIYMTLACLEGARGEVLAYRQWADFEAGAAVTFAAVSLR